MHRSLPALGALALLSFATPAQAQNAACADLLARTTGEVEQLGRDMETQREAMAALAVSSPLLVAMHDGTFRYLGGEDKLPDPAESWFVSEDVIAKKRQQIVTAQDFLDNQREDDCLKVFDEAETAN